MSRRPSTRFSVVSAVYGVSEYLDDFIASIEAQTFPLERVQMVMVDDGSVDGSLEALRAWAARSPDLVTVVQQENAGQAQARNNGLEHATGEWVTFLDPDDAISPAYFENVDRFITQHDDEVDLVATNRWIWNDGTGEVTNTHPLRFMFQRDRLIDLEADGHHFQGSAPASFFRRDRVLSQGNRFDGRIKPAFEDAHFTILYLLCTERPMVGFLGSAHYHYRRRRSGDSALQTARAHPGRYAEMLEHGYLDVVTSALERHGHLPSWLQAHLVSDLSRYFTLTDARAPIGTPIDGPRADRMHALLEQIISHVDVEHYVRRTLAPIPRVPRYVLAHGYAEEPWHEPFVTYAELDEGQNLVQVAYYFSGEPPAEEVLVEGVPTSPLHAKTVVFAFAGRVLLRRRVLWISAERKTMVRLDGEAMTVLFREPAFEPTVATPGLVRWNLARRGGRHLRDAANLLTPVPTTREGRLARRLHYRSAVRKRYAHAWVLMDRIHDAADSGEILFKHIRAEHPEVNAWFVIEKDTSDFKRLHDEGYGDRVVAHGSMRWRLLMANADHLISSHADAPITDPDAITEFVVPRWRYAFLNHGVIKDDLSAWLNTKPIETFVTSTQGEYASIAGDSTYVFSSREVQLSGMPRFDRLHQVGQRFGPEQRDLVLVAPTWRKDLVPSIVPGTQRRELDAAAISASEFMQQWRAFLSDERLRDAAEKHQLTVGFLPHPNLQPALDQLGLPAWVQPLSYDGVDVQEYFARARAFVTDFSSVAFNEAYLERPVVYFQFDEDVVLGGGHVGRGGYFDYRRDGFGPVCTTADEAVTSLVSALEHGTAPMEPYASRIATTFPMRDDQNSERTFQAVLRSGRNRSQEEPEPTPVLPKVVHDPAQGPGSRANS